MAEVEEEVSLGEVVMIVVEVGDEVEIETVLSVESPDI